MLSTTLTTALLSGVAFAAALPTTPHVDAPATGALERRGCKTLQPTLLFQIMEDQPAHNTGNHSYVYTAQADGKKSQVVTEVLFAGIPADAAGSCNVEFSFQAGFNNGGANSQPGITTTGGTADRPTRLEFFSVDRPVDAATDTWENRPEEVSSVGVQIVTASADHDTRSTAVTGACSTTMSYLIKVEGDKEGSVGFFQSEADGLRLTYGC